MPVDISRYPKNWKQLTKQLKDACGWKCQWCGIAHGSIRKGRNGQYKVILTTAHIGENKHDKMDTSNLQVLCQVCHLREDGKEHAENAKVTRRKKKLAVQPLLDGFNDTK